MPKHRRPKGLGRLGMALDEIESRYGFDADRAVFVRLSGCDAALPERLIVRRIEPHPANIPAPLQLATASGHRHISGLWPVSPGVFRGSIPLKNGFVSVFKVQNGLDTDGLPILVIRRELRGSNPNAVLRPTARRRGVQR